MLSCGSAVQPNDESWRPVEFKYDNGVVCYVLGNNAKYGQAVSCVVVR